MIARHARSLVPFIYFVFAIMRHSLNAAAVLCLVLLSQLLFADTAPTWKVDLDESIKTYDFVNGGKTLFFASGKYAWGYDVTTGAKVWDLKVDDYEKKGCHKLFGDKYLVSIDDGFCCYDAVTGKLLWTKKYDGIDQSDFSGVEFTDGIVIANYEFKHLAIDINTGAQLWQAKIPFEGTLTANGSFNYVNCGKLGKWVYMLQDDRIGIYTVKDGRQTFVAEKCEVNMDLVKSKNTWMYASDDQRHLLVVLDDGAVLIDVGANREIVRKQFKIDGDRQVIVPVKGGAIVLGSKETVLFNFAKGTVTSVKYSISDARTFYNYNISGKDLMLLSAKDQMTMLDLTEGTLLWQTKEDAPEFEGFAHRFENADGKPMVYGNDIVIAYNRNRLMSEPGTALYLMSINALTGKLNYKTTVGWSQVVLTALGRWSAKASASMAGNKNATKDIWGYDNIGFDYELMPLNGNIVVVLHTKSGMINPDTKDRGGEGVCVVNPKTGAVVFKDYMRLADDGAAGAVPSQRVRGCLPLFAGNILYLPGRENLAAYDLAANKKLWVIEKEMKGYPTSLGVIDNTLYVKLGGVSASVVLKKDKIDVTKLWDVDPYGFAAIEPASGKVLWRVETEYDPGFITPDFSFANYYNPATKQLYFADKEFVYALQLRPDGGKYDWKFDLDKNKVGPIKLDKAYAISEQKIGTQRTTTVTYYGTYTTSYTTGGLNSEKTADFLEEAASAELMSTYTSWGNIWGVTANRSLRAVYSRGRNMMVVFGPDGIASIDLATGAPKWSTEWDYTRDEVQYLPKIIGDRIVYCVERKMTEIDLNSGKVLWQTKEAKKPRFFSTPDNAYVFSIDDEVVSGYRIK